ncbi:MAG: hypothetical protein EOM88_01520 [Clostridia bacterium]|nr:hypothetical protein [Clostridia bacterium]
MNKTNKKEVNKNLVILIIAIIAIALLSLFVFSKSNEDRGQNNNEAEKLISLEDWEEVHEGLFKVSGVFTCLPVRNEDQPHNDLCVFGIKVATDYYRLEKISDDPLNALNKIMEGQNIEVSGELIDPLSDDDYLDYLSLGTIKVVGVRYLDTSADELKSDLPISFKADYISFSNYSAGIFGIEEYPKLESWVENGQIECNETPLESSLALRTSKKRINGQQYCISAFSEGAAGSVYTQYVYTTVIGDDVYSIIFMANYPNCPNYPDEERAECEAERTSFNLDILVDQEIKKLSANS